MKKNKISIENLKTVMVRLRDPSEGCSWDRKQTFTSVAPFTIEEAYEVYDAIERKDMLSLREELGDLLLQVIFHSRIAEESGHFDFDEVVENIVEKMIRRHPHVFGKKGNQAGKIQLEDWEALKKQERTEKARSKGVVDPSILDDVALAFPALMRAEKLLERAAKSGFKWLEIDSIFNKINEEIEELKIELDGDSISQQKIQEEIGDILLTVVSLARHLKVDPETALRCGNNKFEKRFRFIEKRLVKEKKNLEDTNIEEFELLWQESKLKKTILA